MLLPLLDYRKKKLKPLAAMLFKYVSTIRFFALKVNIEVTTKYCWDIRFVFIS